MDDEHARLLRAVIPWTETDEQNGPRYFLETAFNVDVAWKRYDLRKKYQKRTA